MDPSEKERYEIQVRESAIRMQIPHGFMVDTDVDELIPRADKIAKYILKGEVPPYFEKLEVAPSAGE